MGFFKDFKSFLMKGDIVSLATAVVIGAAFSKIVNSVVNDILMPVIGVFTGGTDFTQKFISLDGESYESLAAAQEAGAAVMTYGNLVQALINFIIVGLFIYLFLKAYENSKKKEEAAKPAKPAGPSQEQLLIEIRDLLAKK
ncbi:large conductance mechanosensitive channel protein MscL [Flavobacteriaceae bacterium KMM 6897]|nr:large conductance mechanosensitive channel protein MscL [Flavobacteriaceae bacterium KMM 6897]MEB8346187.1 large conductance mechanosensitive channel protein MscL [Flavobacteriaceae bacterium KMM 6898]